jgi:precorrin-4/cobalt-precorrin-4 C11-methyltransferase
MAGRTPVPETEALAALARHRASLVIYLSMALVDQVAAALAEAYGPEAPCVIAGRVSHPDERLVHTRTADLARAARQHGIGRLAVIVVGPALADDEALAGLHSRLYDPEFVHGYRTA